MTAKECLQVLTDVPWVVKLCCLQGSDQEFEHRTLLGAHVLVDEAMNKSSKTLSGVAVATFFFLAFIIILLK